MTFWTDLLGVPFEIRYVDAGGTPTRALRAGFSGEPIVFLHGISGHLEGFVPVVAAHAEAFDVHLIDMIGNGYTGPLPGPMTAQILADHIVRYLDAVGLEKAHIVGLSMGGWAGAWLAAHYPERVLSLTLIAAAGDPESKPAKDPKFGEWLRDSTRAGVLTNDIGATRKRLEMVISNPGQLSDELVDIRYAIYHRPEFIAGLEDLLGMTDPETVTRWSLTPEVLSKITCETLVVWGEDDIAAAPDGALGKFLTDGIKATKLVVFTKTGHWIPYERPADFSRVSVAFLKGGLAAVDAGTV